MSKTSDDNGIQIRIAHSQSSKNKVWVTIVMPDEHGKPSEFAVGFDKSNCNKILQVNETVWEDLSDEERDDPMIFEAQAVLALSCYYPVQFVPEPESHELLTFLDDMPTKFIAAKHVEKVFKQHSDMTRWQMYEQISLETAKRSHGHAKAKNSAKQAPVAHSKSSRSSRHAESDESAEAGEEDSESRSLSDEDSRDSRSADDAHEFSASDMDADEEEQYDRSDEGSYDD